MMEDFRIRQEYKNMLILITMYGHSIRNCEIFRFDDRGNYEQIAQFSTLADAIQWIVDDEIGKLKATLFSPGEPPHLANLYRVTSRQNWELLDSNNG